MTTSNEMIIDSVIECVKEGDYGSVKEVMEELIAKIEELSTLNSFLLTRVGVKN